MPYCIRMKTDISLPEIKKNAQLMKKFNFQSMTAHGFLIIPKSLLQQQIDNGHGCEGNTEALLIMLMKVNYSETQYTGYQNKDLLCPRGESMHSYRDWSRIFNWSIPRTFRLIHDLATAGVIEIIPHEDKSLHIRVVEYDKWVGNPEAMKKKKAVNEKFFHFWDEYHAITQLPKENIAKAQREWKKLSCKEQQLAIDKIEEYYFHQTNSKYVLHAGSYLSNKAFLNEY